MRLKFSDILRILLQLSVLLIINFLSPIKTPFLQKSILVAILAFAMIRNSPELNFALILGLIPLNNILSIDSGLIILPYAIFITFFKDFVFNHEYALRKMLLIAFLIFSSWEFLHIYYYSYFYASFGHYKIYINNILLYLTIFYICLFSGRKNHNDYFEYNLIILSLSILFSFIYNFFYNPEQVDITSPFILINDNVRLGGYGYNVNRYAGMVIIILSAIPIALRRNNVQPWILFILFAVFSAIGFLTGSRSFIVAFSLLLISIVFFLSNRKEHQSIKLMILFTGILMLLFLLFNFSYVENFVNQIIARSSVETASGNTRFDLFEYYGQYLISNPNLLLFGYGINSYFYKIGAGFSPHNLFIEPFLAWGLIGLLGLFFLIRQIIKSIYLSSDKRHISLLTALPVSCYIIQSIVSSMWTDQYFYLLLTFCLQSLFVKISENSSIT